MNKHAFPISTAALAILVSLPWLNGVNKPAMELRLTPKQTLETHGLSVLLFHNSYHPVFGDEKMSGLEIILHKQRIATNGDVRLSSTPAQWDAIPQFQERKPGLSPNKLIASLSYPDRAFDCRVDVRPEPGGIRVAVQLDRPLPAALAGKAGFNLEFLPTAYFGKSYMFDDTSGVFPSHPGGPMVKEHAGAIEPAPLGSGSSIVLSPEDAMTRAGITSENAALMLFDGRNQAPNRWFVVRSLIPSNKTGDVLIWHILPKVLAGWLRPPVVGYNQVGYTPDRNDDY